MNATAARAAAPVDRRAALADTMRASLADEQARHNWVYLAARPLPLPGPRGGGYPAGTIKRSDCSWGVRLICWWTPGAPDPMMTGFQGGGNSQTICFALGHVDTPADLEVGDIVTFGTDGDEHAAMVLEPGPDPLLWSDGHQGAPNTYRLSWDSREHQLRRLPIAELPVTPEEELRARTGWFSWVAWKLGEGDWRRYGKANRTVRPDVPAVISAAWWRRYAKFLRNRSKGDGPTS